MIVLDLNTFSCLFNMRLRTSGVNTEASTWSGSWSTYRRFEHIARLYKRPMKELSSETCPACNDQGQPKSAAPFNGVLSPSSPRYLLRLISRQCDTCDRSDQLTFRGCSPQERTRRRTIR